MAEESFQERTEQATPKKREKAREEGDVARSVEIPSVFVLAAGISALYFFAHYFYENMLAIMRDSFRFDSVPYVTGQYCVSLLYRFTSRYLLTLAPVMLAVFVMALFANIYMVGFVISWKAVGLKPERLDPVKGLLNKFTLASLVELVKSIVKLLVIFLLAWLAVRGEMHHINHLYDNSVSQILLYISKIAFKIFIWVILPMVAVAVADYMYQKWQFDEKIKMTKQEIKEEYKESEGDPQVKSRIRALQMEAAKKRMMADVPKADVVVTNPTHLAIAIRYDPASMGAPRVVAKGAGRVAEKIREIARENRVPLVENKPLARNLYKLVEIGQEVPGEFYQAVAELLAYVFRLKGKGMS